MVRLLGNFWVTSGNRLTHLWDASAYLITGDEPTLIDCGSTEGYSTLKRDLKSFGYEPKDIKKVIGTHGHWDHVSAVANLQAESNAQLFIHSADRQQVETGDPALTASYLYNKPFPPARVDGLLAHGDVLDVNGYAFEVYHTPGHSPGSVSLRTEFHGLKLLIAADTIWGGYHPRIRSSLEDWEQSLDRLLELEFDVMTTGHCPPALIFDAKRHVYEARQQLGVYWNP
ncbi:MAG: MBL fold metallo-hydrolase, partial [Chloroflexota bacterium]|nr:MBL fold metallo-hydrolase [Chloroflexota bacterium]